MKSQHIARWTACGLILVGSLTSRAGMQTPNEKRWHKVVITAEVSWKEDENSSSGGTSSNRKTIKIEALEPNLGKEPKEVAWLGIFTEEASEALSSQLGFKSGEGLLVLYVAPDSPASKASLQKNDVLVEMGDQLLVHPLQLRKLVRSKKEGETIKLGFFRQGKKQSASATLAKTIDNSGSWERNMLSDGLQVELGEMINDGMRDAMKNVPGSIGPNKHAITIEVQRSMEEARKALKEALSQNSHAHSVFGSGSKDLEAFAFGKVKIEDDATVVVKKDANSVKTILRTDETGTYIIVADPKKRLTAHDKAGKLLFEGEIESEEQQKKVPRELWNRIKPMLEQFGKPEDQESKPQAKSTGEIKS